MSDDAKDTGYAAPKWAFDDEVTRVFEDMLWRSIPAYAVMRELCHDVGMKFVKDNTSIIDLGCSRGGALAKIAETRKEANSYIGAEVSAPMIEAARLRFQDSPTVSIQEIDLRYGFPTQGQPASLVLSVLTLQFIPIEYRQRVIRRSFDALQPGGALILVEKILGGNSSSNATLVDLYYGFKLANGYTQDEIDRKRFALEGVLVPQTEAANISMLKQEGFQDVECFWRYLNFAAWLAVR